MLYTDKIRDIQRRMQSHLDDVNETLSELYVRKSQVDELRRMDNSTADTYLRNFQSVSPEDEITMFQHRRDELREGIRNLESLIEVISDVPDEFLQCDDDLSTDNPYHEVMSSVKDVLTDVEQKLAKREVFSSSQTLQKTNIPVQGSGGESREIDLLHEAVIESRAVELFDDTDKQHKYLASIEEYPYGEPAAKGEFRENESFPGDPIDINDDIMNTKPATSEIPSYALETIVTKADNLYEARTQTATECLQIANSLQELLITITNDSTTVEFTELIDDLDFFTGQLQVKVDSPNDLTDDDELVTIIEDNVINVKDTAFAKLSN